MPRALRCRSAPSSSARRRCRWCAAARSCSCEQLVARAARARHRHRSRVAAVQVVSEGRDPAARGGVAAARSSESNGRPIDLDHRDEVPDLLRAASEQGVLARAPAPRRLRAVRHRLQRLRRRRDRRRAARSPDGARRGDARRVPRALHDLADGLARGWRSTTASPRRRSIIRRSSRRCCRPASTARTCCRSRGSKGTSASISPSRAMAHLPSHLRLVVVGEGSHRALIEQAAEEAGVGGSRHVCRRGRRRRAGRAVSRRAVPRLRAVRRGLRAGDARSVSGAKPVDHGTRFRRHAGIRPRRRQRLRRRARSGGDRRRDRDGSTPIARSAASLGAAGRDAALARSRGTRVIDRLLSHG